METKKMRAQGKRGKANQTVRSWLFTISVKFKDPDKRMTGKIVNPIETS
jgi:hypothetical protein